jgi:hypothetical protein
VLYNQKRKFFVFCEVKKVSCNLTPDPGKRTCKGAGFIAWWKITVVQLASYWFDAPTLTLPAGHPTAGLRGLRCTTWCGAVNTATSSSHALGSRPEFEPSRRARPGSERRIALSRYERPFPGISCPTTLEIASSDQHRACLTRLRYAFRFSQPLDASFRPHPSDLVSCR